MDTCVRALLSHFTAEQETGRCRERKRLKALQGFEKYHLNFCSRLGHDLLDCVVYNMHCCEKILARPLRRTCYRVWRLNGHTCGWLRWALWVGFVYGFQPSLYVFRLCISSSETWPLSILGLALLVNLWSLPGSNLKLHFFAPLRVGWTKWARWPYFSPLSVWKKKMEESHVSHWLSTLFSVWILLRPSGQIQGIVHLSTSVAGATVLLWLSAYNNRQIRQGRAALPPTFHLSVIRMRMCELELCPVDTLTRREVLNIFKSDGLVRKLNRWGINVHFPSFGVQGTVECSFQFQWSHFCPEGEKDLISVKDFIFALWRRLTSLQEVQSTE